MKEYDKHFFHVRKLYDKRFLSTRVGTINARYILEIVPNWLKEA